MARDFIMTFAVCVRTVILRAYTILYIRVRAIIYSNMVKRGGRAGVADVPRGCLRSLNQQLRSVVQKYRFGVL